MKVWKLIALILTLALCLVGVFVGWKIEKGYFYGSYGSTRTYGADFYTHIQNDVVRASENIYKFGNMMDYTLDYVGWLICIFCLIKALKTITEIVTVISEIKRDRKEKLQRQLDAMREAMAREQNNMSLNMNQPKE